MRGDSKDKEHGAGGAEPPHALAAGIGELLEALRDTHLRRVAQLRLLLQSGTFGWDHSGLAQAISAVHSAGRELHIRDLRQSWIRQLMGEHRAVYSRFVAAYDRIVTCAARLKMEAAETAAASQPRHVQAEEALAQLSAELASIEAVVDGGVARLEAMCASLGDPDAAHEDPRMIASAEAAHRFTEQFRRLSTLTALGADVRLRARSVLARRTALLDAVRTDVQTFEVEWMRAVSGVVAAARDGRDPAHAAGRILEVHDDLMRRLSLSADACSALQEEEQLLVRQLGQLKEELDALQDAA